MLTATYTLVAVTAEQNNARSLLSRLRQCIEDFLARIQELDVPKIETMLDYIAQFDQYCHARKFERYLIPSVRGTAREVDLLVTELESMSANAVESLKTAREKLRQSVEQGADRLQELCRAMETYCDNLLTRLRREEEELLPLLGRLLSGEQWFPIATQFLSAEELVRTPHKVMPRPMVFSA
jgi:hemerythrin-like domain-containing protein